VALRKFVDGKNKYTWMLLFGAIWGLVYLTTNHKQLFPPSYLPLSFVDKNMPFLPWTVWIYVSDFIYPLVAYILLKESRNLSVTVTSFAIMAAIAVSFFVLFPTIYPRPVASAEEVGWLMAWLWRTDSPANCFPSTHVSIVFVVLIALKNEYPRLYWPFLGWALLICLSTLTTKQHYLIDVIGGVAVAMGSTTLAEKLVTHESDACEQQERV
jgi:membrane-associated phospholipid phosphatase